MCYFHNLREEAAPSDQTALEWVIHAVKKEVARLEDMAEHIIIEEGAESEALQDIYDRYKS